MALPEPDRLLLAFALPVLAAITVQALLSRAHANWAAVSYVSATVLLAAILLRDVFARLAQGFVWPASGRDGADRRRHGDGRPRCPAGVGDPFARTLGWREVAEATRAELARARSPARPTAPSSPTTGR